MSQEPPVSSWARQHFGEYALSVRDRLATALGQSQTRAVLIQQMSGLDTKQPYGGMWPKTHQEIETQMSDLPMAQRFRPPRAPYNLMVVNGRLLLPFRHSDSLAVPIKKAKLLTKVARELSALLAAAAPAADLFSYLDGDELDEAPVLRRPELVHLEPQTKVIYVPYVSDAHAGLVKAWWGEASMLPDGTLVWNPEPEELPLFPAQPAGSHLSTSNQWLPRLPRFDEGDLPPLVFPDDPDEMAR